MRRTYRLAIVCATLLVVAAAYPAAATAEDDTSPIALTVDQDPAGTAIVQVTAAGAPLENATVTVAPADENTSYAGSGEYVTDENGTVTLPAPNETVSVAVTATGPNATATTTVDLEAPGLNVAVEQDADAAVTVTVTNAITDSRTSNASVTVDTLSPNATYRGAGDYTTDDDGTVRLPAPDRPVEVEITATAEGLTGSAAVTLENASTVEPTPEPFGQRVSAFVHSLLNGDAEERRLGRLIAQFVTANNPGNAPEHAGPPSGVGPDADTEADHPRGADADHEPGPPPHANAGGDDVETDRDEDQMDNVTRADHEREGDDETDDREADRDGDDASDDPEDDADDETEEADDDEEPDAETDDPQDDEPGPPANPGSNGHGR